MKPERTKVVERVCGHFDRRPLPYIFAAIIVLSFLLAALLYGVAHAATSTTVAWTNPTKNCNGSALTNQASTRIYRAANKAQLPASVPPGQACTTAPVDYAPFAQYLIATVPYPGSTYIDSVPDATLYYYAVTVVTADGVESNPTTPAVNTRPAPPGTVTLTTAAAPSPAYMMVRGADCFIAIPVGTVQGGTPCDARNAVVANSAIFYTVPTAAVSWYGPTRPTVVVAECS